MSDDQIKAKENLVKKLLQSALENPHLTQKQQEEMIAHIQTIKDGQNQDSLSNGQDPDSSFTEDFKSLLSEMKVLGLGVGC